MKAKLIIFAATLFLGTSAFSQRFTLGIKGGVNMGKLSGSTFTDKFTMGYQIGGFSTIPIGEKFGIQPEVMFNQTNLDTASRFSEIYPEFSKMNDIQLNSLTVPIMINYNMNKFMTLQAGPQFGVIIDQNKNLLQNGEAAFKSGNFALAGGLQLKISKIRIYGRFVGGLTNLDNVGNKESWKTASIQLGVGLAL